MCASACANFKARVNTNKGLVPLFVYDPGINPTLMFKKALKMTKSLHKPDFIHILLD